MTVARRTAPSQALPGARFVAPAERPVAAPRADLFVRLGDRTLVQAGEAIHIGQPVIERSREAVLLEVPVQGELWTMAPGSEIDTARLQVGKGAGRQHPRPGDRAYLLYVGSDRVARVVLGRAPLVVVSPVDGVVEEAAAGHISIRASGIGLYGPVAWGQPVVGRVIMAVSSPDAELRAGAVDISAAGGILVAGARLDIEALTRARAIGVAGIVCGGVVGRELAQLEESDQRQRAALHATTPFAILALDGYGRRPLPILAWDLLDAAAAEERQVGIVPDSRLAVVAGDPSSLPLPRWPEDAVRLTAGEGVGRAGRLVGLAGPIRRAGGVYQPAGHVILGATGDTPARRLSVPLADLERLG